MRRTAVVAGLALLAGVGIGRATAGLEWPTFQQERPDIVLLTIDTLRADHLPFYGYHRDTAPFLSSLAAEGVVFENASSTSSWTSPSMASLVTSLYPAQHGVETTADEKTEGAYTQAAISRDVTTIAEHLKGLGYETFGVVTNLHIAQDLGFAQGFDHFENVGFSQSGEPVFQGVQKIREQLAASHPHFLWIHFFDPHAPYRLAEPYLTTFDLESGERFPLIAGQDKPARRQRWKRWANKQLSNIENDPKTATNPIVIETLRTLYDAELRDSDDWVRNTIELVGLERDDVLLFTADHGEEFREHGFLGHRNTLHIELTHVPMLLWSPERLRTGTRVKEPSSLVDVLPTLVEAAGGAPPEGIQGKSLWGAARKGEPPPPRDLLLGLHNQFGDSKAMVRWPMKVIERHDGQVLLFDLSADPGETKDLAPGKPLEAQKLRDAMHAAYAGLPRVAQEQATVEASQVEMLHELGYMEAEAEEPPETPPVP